MERQISIGQLRQNPTAMLRAVRRGEIYTVTDRGEPIADIAPHRPGPWRRTDRVQQLLHELGPNQSWLRDQETLREDAHLEDPYGLHH